MAHVVHENMCATRSPFATEIGVWRRRHTSSNAATFAGRDRRTCSKAAATTTRNSDAAANDVEAVQQQPNISQIKYNIFPEHHDDCVVDAAARRRLRRLAAEAPKFDDDDDVERRASFPTSCTIARARTFTCAFFRCRRSCAFDSHLNAPDRSCVAFCRSSAAAVAATAAAATSLSRSSPSATLHTPHSDARA